MCDCVIQHSFYIFLVYFVWSCNSFSWNPIIWRNNNKSNSRLTPLNILTLNLVLTFCNVTWPWVRAREGQGFRANLDINFKAGTTLELSFRLVLAQLSRGFSVYCVIHVEADGNAGEDEKVSGLNLLCCIYGMERERETKRRQMKKEMRN